MISKTKAQQANEIQRMARALEEGQAQATANILEKEQEVALLQSTNDHLTSETKVLAASLEAVRTQRDELSAENMILIKELKEDRGKLASALAASNALNVTLIEERASRAHIDIALDMALGERSRTVQQRDSLQLELDEERELRIGLVTSLISAMSRPRATIFTIRQDVWLIAYRRLCQQSLQRSKQIDYS